MRSSILSLPVLFFAKIVYTQSGQCYYANGNPLPDDPKFFNMFEPCTSGGPSTICCATNRTNPAGGDAANGDTKDECLPNGLCQNRVTKNGVESTVFFANFCTNKDFNSSDCLHVCEQTRGSSGNTAMTSCTGKADSERWCCGGGNTACCSTGVGLVTLPKILGVIVSSSIVSSAQTSSTPSSLASPSRSASSASTSGTNAPASSGSSIPIPTSPKKPSKLSGGAIAGIVIGVLAGIALLGAAIFFAMRANKYKKQASAQPQISEAPANPSQYGHNGYEMNGAEKYAQTQAQTHWQPPVEMQQPPSELPGGEYALQAAHSSPHSQPASPHVPGASPHMPPAAPLK